MSSKTFSVEINSNPYFNEQEDVNTISENLKTEPSGNPEINTNLETITEINWGQIWSLAGLNAAVVISWIAYHNYQPKILQKFNFLELGSFLAISQMLILVIIPPIAGLIADFIIRKNGKRFVVFTLGVSITAMIFMAVAFTISDAAFVDLKWLLPTLIVLWLISMNIFHSPANSMIELFASARQLPVVMSVIVLVTDLLFALEPLVIAFVDSIGATLTFVTGGVLLMISGYVFRKNTGENIVLSRQVEPNEEPRKNNFTLAILTGITFGIVCAILMNIFPSLLAKKLVTFSGSSLGGNHFVSLILGMAAILAIPISKIVQKIGITQSIIWSLIFTFSLLSIIILSKSPELCATLCLFIAVAFSFLSVSAFPFVIQNLSKRNITLGAGLFYGFAELADGLMNIYFK